MVSFSKVTLKNYNDFTYIYKELNTVDIKSFRYFENRGLIHVLNVYNPEMGYFNSEPFGYYHLDLDDDICWFGIFIIPKFRKKGLSSILIERSKLIAKKNGINKISLSVDSSNINAINSYIKNDFTITLISGKITYMSCSSI